MLFLFLLGLSPAAFCATPESPVLEPVAARTDVYRTEESEIDRLIEAGQYSRALIIAEQAVMDYPENAGAWLDLALVYLAMGDWNTANALLDSLEATFHPEGKMQELINLLRPLQQAPAINADSAIKFRMALLYGHETNFGATTSASNISLQFPDGAVLLELSPKDRPRSGYAGLLELHLEGGRFVSAETSLLGTVDSRHRYAVNAAEYNTNAYSARVGLRRSFGQRAMYLWGGAGESATGDGNKYRSSSVQITAEPAVQAFAIGHEDWLCRLQLGGEAEWRKYPGQDALNGFATTYFINSRCGAIRDGLFFGLRHASDEPDSLRPGGRQQGMEYILGGEMSLGQSSRFDLWWSTRNTTDAEPYSALFGTTVRKIDYQLLKLEYAYTFSRSLISLSGQPLAAVLRLERHQQKSSIALFSYRNDAIYTGLALQF